MLDLTDNDLKWAQLQASNWMYSEHLDWSEDEHHIVTSIILFVLQRLDTHAPEAEANANAR